MKHLLPKDPKLAFFDIDGTLLGLDGNYTQRVKKAIRQAQQAGIKTAIASGRPKFSADYLISELGITAAGVFYTGALVFDPIKNMTISEHHLDLDDVQGLISTARIQGLYTEVCFRDHYVIETDHPINRQHSVHLRSNPLRRHFHELNFHEPVIKLLMAVQNVDEHEKLYELERTYPHLVFAYAKMPVNPDWLFVSIIHGRACKRAAFAQLLEYHQVNTSQVLAFGDAHSDKEFLELAGTGVAMGNANDDVKAVADVVTLPVWEDGVAHVLEQLL